MSCCGDAAIGWMRSGLSGGRTFSPTDPATARRSAARSTKGCSPEPGAAARAAALGCCSATRALNAPGGGPFIPKTRAARTPSATCRRSASPGMPASATRLYANASSRKDFLGIQESVRQREDGWIFCALEGGERVLLENASVALHRQRGERRPQPGDPAAPWGRWDGAEPAGVERGGEAAGAAAGDAQRQGHHDQRLGWFMGRKPGVEFRRSGGTAGVSCALALDSREGGGEC
jgi:hypothetical protein